MAGADGVTPERFGRRLPYNLSRLGRELREGRYETGPLLRVQLRERGKTRDLGIPTVRDRVAQRAFLHVLAKPLHANASEAAFAYRKGRSWLDALKAAEQCRDQGLQCVFRGDILEFFDRVEHDLLLDRLGKVVKDRAAMQVLRGWMTAPVVTDGGLRTRTIGLPQGSSLSPALANFYLLDFDQAVDGLFGRLVRYADDFAVFCLEPEQAERARTAAEQALRRVRLELNPAKSYVSSFERGFSFLGWVFFRAHGWEEDPNDRWTHPMSVGREHSGLVV